MHPYIIFINKLYSGIFILPAPLTPSMFVYLNWKNKNGDILKTLLEENKAKDIASKMEAQGIEVQLTPETSITYIK
tara:strand:- start:268 stop:495 length:228 start_codon:yes stop_codon:yes gene_type:complete